MIYQRVVDLNLIPGKEIKHIHVNQRDEINNGLRFNLYNDDRPFTLPGNIQLAYISGTKPDRHAFQYVCDRAVYNDSYIIASLNYQMTIVPGPVECELTIKNTANETIGTANFILDVEPGALIDNPDISKSELYEMELTARHQIDELNTYLDVAKELDESGKTVIKWCEDYAPKFDELLKKANDEFKRVDGYASQTIAQARQAQQYLDTSTNYLNQTKEYYQDAQEIALEYENEARKYANSAYTYISSSSDWAKTSESWAIGHTGVRDGEDTNNSRYWSYISQSYAGGGTNKRDGEATDNARYWSQISKENCDKTEEYMNVVETYTNIVIPTFEIDLNTMTLYQTNYTTDSQLKFSLDGNDVLYYELVA